MSSNNTQINPNLIIAVGAIGLVFMGGKKIFEALGLSKSADDVEREREIKTQMLDLSAGDYFDPDFYKKQAGSVILTVSSAQKLAQYIYDAKGFFNDDEAKVYGVFQLLKTRSQVSFLAAVFFSMYKKSLLGYLLSFMNDSEMAAVAKITNKLPPFRI